MRTVLGSVLAVALVATAADGRQDRPVDGKKLVGKWEPKEAKKDIKMTIEFTKDNKVTVTIEPAGKKALSFGGSYALDGAKLKMKLAAQGKEVEQDLAVLKLTDDELETEDAKGKKETLLRAKDKP